MTENGKSQDPEKQAERLIEAVCGRLVPELDSEDSASDRSQVASTVFHYGTMVAEARQCMILIKRLCRSKRGPRVLRIATDLSHCVDDLIAGACLAFSPSEETSSFPCLHWLILEEALGPLVDALECPDGRRLWRSLGPGTGSKPEKLRYEKSSFIASDCPVWLANCLLASLESLYCQSKAYSRQFSTALRHTDGPANRLGLALQALHAAAARLLGSALGGAPSIKYFKVFMISLYVDDPPVMRQWLRGGKGIDDSGGY